MRKREEEKLVFIFRKGYSRSLYRPFIVLIFIFYPRVTQAREFQEVARQEALNAARDMVLSKR